MIGIATDEEPRCTYEYLAEAQQLAQNVERSSDPGCEEWDLAQYTSTVIQELWRLRSRVAYLEGWKEGAEGVKQSRPKIYRNGSPAIYRNSSPADETRQAAEDRLNRT